MALPPRPTEPPPEEIPPEELPPGTILDPATGKPRTFVPAPGSGMDTAINPPEEPEEPEAPTE